MLYELLLGDRPFSGNYNQLMVSHLNYAVKPPSTLPTEIQVVLKKATEKLTRRRFRSATEMKTAIIQARQTLTAGDLRERFPQVAALNSSGSFKPQDPLVLPAMCSAMTLNKTEQSVSELVVASGQDLYSWPLTDSQTVATNAIPTQWSFDSPVTQLCTVPSGIIVITQQKLSLLTSAGLSSLAGFDSAIKVLPGSQRWVFVQSLESPTNLWVIDTQKQNVVVPHKLPAPDTNQELTSVVVLDERHYAIAYRQDKQSQMHIVTRKGHLLGQLSIQSPIHSLFASQDSACCIALAGPQKRDLLVIRFSPYRIVRFRLDITPTWLGELTTGYVAISQKGEMRLVNFDGQLIGQVNNLPRPTAICFQPPHHIWLACLHDNEPQLHSINLQTLNLDIIFSGQWPMTRGAPLQRMKRGV